MDAPQTQPQPQPKKPFAWQPLTFRGVSRFAVAPLGRLWLIQFLFSLIIAAAVIWLLYVDWFPVVGKAARRLPTASEIRAGQLDWPSDPALLLAENRFMAVAIDLNHAGQARSPAHVSVELGLRDYKVFSLFGYLQWRYPRHWIISLARDDVIAWWGAWSPVILAGVAASAIGLLTLFWTVFSTIYFLPLWLLAFFCNRELTLKGSWRLSGAAQMPGVLLLAAALFAYGLGWFGLVGLALGFAAHLVMGWVYLIWGTFGLPLAGKAADLRENPFAAKALSTPTGQVDSAPQPLNSNLERSTAPNEQPDPPAEGSAD